MKEKLILLALLLLGSISISAQDEVPAFPGAEGFGRYAASGGRGGKVIHVTNLNDSGKGSLRAAIDSTGYRTIVFDVGGEIDLESNLIIKNGNLTIAGQTAPYPGITVRYYTTQIKANNIIIRFVRFRRGNERDIDDGADAFWGRNQYYIILDHCSFSWSIDECASFYDNKNFTLQWCSVAESLNNAGHEKGSHGYGGIWGGKSASFHHNLIAHHNNRTPRLNGARYGWLGKKSDNYASCIEAEQVDLRNNLIYNWGQGNGAYGGPGGYHNIVNNYYKYGPATKNQFRVFQVSFCEGETIPDYTYGHFFIDGNYVRDKGPYYDWSGVTIDLVKGGQLSEIEDTIKLTSPIATGDITTHTAEKAYEKVMAYAGASLYRDAFDARYMEEAETGTATYKGSVSGYSGIIDVVADVGGFPEVTPTYRSDDFDTDGDGIPDEWEIDNGLDPTDAEDGKLYTVDTRGWYTNLEVYMNAIVETIMAAENEDAIEKVNEYYPACSTSTSISKAIVPTSEISKVEYYTIGGAKISAPQKGISIRKITYSNGQKHVEKVIK